MKAVEIGRLRRCVLALCELTALVAPAEWRAALVAERRSHLFESARAGTAPLVDLLAAARGVIDDLRLAGSCRAEAGCAPLVVSVFTDATMSLVACGLFVVLLLPGVFLPGWLMTVVIRRVALSGASVVLFGGYGVRAWVRLRGSRGSRRSRTG